MELNDGADISQHSFFTLDTQALHSVENEAQAASHILGSNSSFAERKVWYPENDGQQIISSELPQQVIPGHHQAKRQHFWNTNPYQPSSSDELIGSSGTQVDLHPNSFGCCEKANSGPMSFDVPFSGHDGAGSSSVSSSHFNPRPEVASWQLSSAMRTETWSTQAGLHPDSNPHNAFVTSGEYQNFTGGLGSDSIRLSTEDVKGKRLDYQNIHTDVGGLTGPPGPLTLGGNSFNRYGSFMGSSADLFGKFRSDEINSDLRGAYKRKISTVDSAETFDADAHTAGGNGGQSAELSGGIRYDMLAANRFINGNAVGNPSIRQIQNNPDDCNEYFKSVVDSYGPQQDLRRCHQLQNYSAFPGPNHLHLHSLLSRNSTVSSPHADVRMTPEVNVGSTSTAPNMENWLSMFGERSSVLPVTRNWAGNNVPRRGSSPLFCPEWSERIGFPAMSEQRNLRSNSGRQSHRAATTLIENRFTNQSDSIENMIASTSSATNPHGYAARTREPLNTLLSPGSLSSFLAASGNGHRLARNQVIPVPSRQLPLGLPLETSLPSANQHGNWNPSSFHQVRREALLAGPVQNVLGLPFRGIGVLQTDRDYRRQFLSEILTAMHHVFRNEALSIEDVVMLDSSAVNPETDVHDQYGDMRLDVDNMSYEELLALEERIGSVSTGLNDDTISLCLREIKYSSLDATLAAISEESDVKCTICQEEYIEEDDLGTLDCGHGYHSSCIKQWLLHKNECPICKSPAFVKS